MLRRSYVKKEKRKYIKAIDIYMVYSKIKIRDFVFLRVRF